MAWLNDQRFGQKSRLFTVIQAPPSVEGDNLDGDDTPRRHFSPAPGFHFFWYRGRLMWLQRELSMNLQVIETIRRGALFASRQLMEDLLQSVARHAGEPARGHALVLELGGCGLLARAHGVAACCALRESPFGPPCGLMAWIVASTPRLNGPAASACTCSGSSGLTAGPLSTWP